VKAAVDTAAKTAVQIPTQSPTTESIHGAAIAGQPAVDIAAAGMQTTSQHNGKDGTRGMAKASSTGTMSPGGQAAKAQDASMNMAAAHPQDAVATDSHAGSSDAPGGTTARTSLPQAGIQSYGQLAGGLARPLPAQATLITHKGQAAGLRADAATGPASIPGQDPTAGNMVWAAGPGIGQNTQAMANPQTAMPQAPVHSSGPWTAMAAMAEIGQAAANGHSRLELKLEPAHLGKVHVRIDSDSHKNIQVHLIVEQAASQQAIQQQLPNLRHVLEQQGLNLGNFSMSSQQQGGGQGSGQPGQQQAATASVPSVHGAQASTPQIMNAPNEQPGAGRLSIRI
jgi:flagellar hook-length control protein FliK